MAELPSAGGRAISRMSGTRLRAPLDSRKLASLQTGQQVE